FLLMTRLPPLSTLFPYTTLFRSSSKPRSAKTFLLPLVTGILLSGLPVTFLFPAAIARNPPWLVSGEPRSDRFRASASLHRSLIRSEEHTSELQSRGHLVCRLLLE